MEHCFTLHNQSRNRQSAPIKKKKLNTKERKIKFGEQLWTKTTWGVETEYFKFLREITIRPSKPISRCFGYLNLLKLSYLAEGSTPLTVNLEHFLSAVEYLFWYRWCHWWSSSDVVGFTIWCRWWPSLTVLVQFSGGANPNIAQLPSSYSTVHLLLSPAHLNDEGMKSVNSR